MRRIDLLTSLLTWSYFSPPKQCYQMKTWSLFLTSLYSQYLDNKSLCCSLQIWTKILLEDRSQACFSLNWKHQMHPYLLHFTFQCQESSRAEHKFGMILCLLHYMVAVHSKVCRRFCLICHHRTNFRVQDHLQVSLTYRSFQTNWAVNLHLLQRFMEFQPHKV